MEQLQIMSQRHSVRQYLNKNIEIEIREVLNQYAEDLNKKSGLSIQIVYDEPDCFHSLFSKVMNFQGCSNYIVIAGDKKDENLSLKAGYYGEFLVLKAQEIGLNTCWVAATHGKTAVSLPESMKEVIVISLGYGATEGKSHRNKDISTLCKLDQDNPEWFDLGVKGAMLAPTAMNQQKFYLYMNEDKAFCRVKDSHLILLDGGIVKCHFELASGHSLEMVIEK